MQNSGSNGSDSCPPKNNNKKSHCSREFPDWLQCSFSFLWALAGGSIVMHLFLYASAFLRLCQAALRTAPLQLLIQHNLLHHLHDALLHHQITQKNRSRQGGPAKHNYRRKAPWDSSQRVQGKHTQGQLSPLHCLKISRLDLHTNSMALKSEAVKDVKGEVKGQFITVKTHSCDSFGMMALLDRSY